MEYQLDQLQQQMLEMQQHMANMTVALRDTRDRAQAAEDALAQQSAVPASPPSASSRQRPTGFELVDTKLLTKPRSFGGKEEEWGSWSFKMLAYVGALDGEMLKELMAASLEAVVANVQNSRMTTEGQERSRQMYYILILLLEGQALQVVKALPSGEGYRVWRTLQERYEPAMPSRHAGLLQEIISYRFQPEQIEAAIADFEYKITKYETQSGEKIGEKLKIAIIQKGLHDGQMQGHLVLHAARLNTWDAVRNEVQAVLQTRIAIAACQSVPMEI